MLKQERNLKSNRMSSSKDIINRDPFIPHDRKASCLSTTLRQTSVQKFDLIMYQKGYQKRMKNIHSHKTDPRKIKHLRSNEVNSRHHIHGMMYLLKPYKCLKIDLRLTGKKTPR